MIIYTSREGIKALEKAFEEEFQRLIKEDKIIIQKQKKNVRSKRSF
jgi:hypothetical protein